MGYMHIDNLYKDSRIFNFDECYALEKIHGTSAHVAFKGRQDIVYFSGGETASKFVALFEGFNFTEKVAALFDGIYFMQEPKELVVYGEAYGGKQQGMRETYGDALKFIAFDVKVDGVWLDVPNAEHVAKALGFEFVDYVRIPTKLHQLDEQRDRPSVQAMRNGVQGDKVREGIVIRPIAESVDHRGNRIISKHKSASFCETKTQREVDPEKLQRLKDAAKIAEEWVTDNRLHHVLDQALVLKREASDRTDTMGETFTLDIKDTGAVIKLMTEDVRRESEGEAEFSDDVIKQIGGATARLYKKWLASQLQAAHTEVAS